MITKVFIPNKKFRITNIYDENIWFDVESGHIRHIHRPLWLNVDDLMDSSYLRMDKLKIEQTDEELNEERLKMLLNSND